MTTNLTNRKGIKLQLTGDLLTGDTFSMKDWIKGKLDGKWVADQKAWRVDVAKLNWMIENYILVIDTEAVPVKNSTSGMTYAQFVRSADDANSDF